ncbi:MAG: hypothetical protein GX249_12140, partial [Firmicutes bacterium]|nr:hypothetical protein [Bacillota bacterium]
VIYFSGESGANFLRPSDDIGGNNRITDGELEEWVRKFGGTVTLIIDAHEAETFADGPVLESQAFKKSYYTVLGATRKNQDAGAHEDRYHSWFTYHLLEGIRTRDADYNRDGDITASELYEYTYGAMQGDSSQTPFFWPGTNGNAVVYRYKR